MQSISNKIFLFNEIVLSKRRITADTALRLAQYYGTTAKFWLGLQTDYDLDVAADELGERLEGGGLRMGLKGEPL